MKTTRLSIFPSLTLFLTSLTLLAVLSAQAQVPSYVPTNGLVGWWPFNGNSNDESGNGNNGTVNGATLTADRFGNENSAYSFAGVPDRIDIGTNLNPNFSIGTPTSSWSVSSWINRNNLNGVLAFSDYNSIAGNTNPGENDMTFITLQVDQSIAYASFRTNGVDVNVSGGNISSDQWHQIAYTVNNGILKLFVDGNEVAQTFFNSNFNFNESPFYRIGCAMWNGNYGPSLGVIDDVSVFNRALTADEVLALYNGCNVAPLAVSGNVTPTQFTQETYTYPNTVGSTYDWTVTNGVILSGQGTNSIDVVWANTGIGSVTVVETNVTTCSGDAVTYDVVVIPTNIEELSNALILYPNPATTELNLQITLDLIGTDLFVFDALGKQILKQQILSTNTIINTSSFAVGNYVVKVGGGVKKFTVEK